MARFFVGQRVRVVAVGCDEFKFAVGVETWIDADVGSFWHLEIHEPQGFLALVCKDSASDFISPILPEGHQPAELTVEELLPFLKKREVSDVAL